MPHGHLQSRDLDALSTLAAQEVCSDTLPVCAGNQHRHRRVPHDSVSSPLGQPVGGKVSVWVVVTTLRDGNFGCIEVPERVQLTAAATDSQSSAMHRFVLSGSVAIV